MNINGNQIKPGVDLSGVALKGADLLISKVALRCSLLVTVPSLGRGAWLTKKAQTSVLRFEVGD